MGKIEILGKFDLVKNNWCLGRNINNSTSLAVASYESIRNSDEQKYDYIIYSWGSRVENHSKDTYSIKYKEGHVDSIIDYFKTKKHNIKVKFIMLDKDAPLREDGIILSKYINNLCSKDDCNSVNIIGYSKSGAMFFNMIKFIDPKNYSKINLYNSATPYLGTKMASPKFIYKDIERLLRGLIPNKKLSNFIYDKTIKVYTNISSNSHMDFDIALPNGIPDDYLDRYDSNLISELLKEENINSVKSLNRFQNFTTGIDETTFKRALKKADFTGISMCMINDLLMDKASDGFVATKSQEEVSKYIEIPSIYLKGAHHDCMADELYYNNILSSINENLFEDKEKKSIKKIK